MVLMKLSFDQADKSQSLYDLINFQALVSPFSLQSAARPQRKKDIKQLMG
jgi:hypothetical protein